MDVIIWNYSFQYSKSTHYVSVGLEEGAAYACYTIRVSNKCYTK
jgi:hypothetical protein